MRHFCENKRQFLAWENERTIMSLMFTRSENGNNKDTPLRRKENILMETKVKTKSTPNKRVEKVESKMADGTKKMEKTTSKRKMDGTVETKAQSKIK